MKILGLAGALGHDPACALFIDGRLVVAAEEERFNRDKHAKRCFPTQSLSWCLADAGLKPADVDAVAIAFAPMPLWRGRLQYAMRNWYAPDRAFDALFMGNRRFYRYRRQVVSGLRACGFDLARTKLIPVEHHLAHASSAYHLSGFKEKTAIIGIDGKGEYASTFLGVGEHGKIIRRYEVYEPDSLGGLYGALTEYLGFDMLDGEFKVMGMAAYGDAARYDFSRLLHFNQGHYRVNNQLINTIGLRRYKADGRGYFFSRRLIDWLGPPRKGDTIDEPYIHYAAAIQQLLERAACHLIEYHLGDIIRDTGKLCFAGGVALNVKLNQKIRQLDGVKELFVQPAASDAGTAIGAAAYVCQQDDQQVETMRHAYLGPQYTASACLAAVQADPRVKHYQQLDDPVESACNLLVAGHPLAWFQGRMEFGPRALGNRSILGHPAIPGIADRINQQIKYRERWRPFCPSMLDTVASTILGCTHPAPYMTLSFSVDAAWRKKIPEVVHEDGTVRAQIVTRANNARFYDLISALQHHGGHGVILNTSLNRRGEPMVCSPEDALNMFYGCGLQFLILENILVTKEAMTCS